MEDKPTTYKPKQDTRVEVSRMQTAGKGATYILHNPDADTYIEIDAQNYFLWELMDGEHELAALAMAYLGEYGALPFDRLSELIAQLEANFLLEGTSPIPEQKTANGTTPRIKRFADTAFQREFNWQEADEFFSKFYKHIGWMFYTRPALITMGLIATAGFAIFLYLALTEEYHLLRVNNSYGLGILVLLLANIFVLFWHEAGHGLTCKSFGRRIRKAGLMFYYGNPAFFVDVSDMWMEARGPRIWVSLAGPLVNLLIGSTLATLVILFPSSGAAQVLFVGAFAAYLNAFFNLNPLLELDGYYVLIDLLQTRQLRQKSFHFVRKDLLPKIRTHSRFSHEEIMYSVYGILAIVYTALTILLTIYFWRRELQLLVQQLLTGEDILASVLVGGLALAAATWLIVGLAARIFVWADAARQRRRSIPEGSGQED